MMDAGRVGTWRRHAIAATKRPILAGVRTSILPIVVAAMLFMVLD